MSVDEGDLEPLNPSEDIVVMVDEAHRTQYGILGARMSKAIPNATLIGFTGTPIDRDFKRSTMRRFGSAHRRLHDPAVGVGWCNRADPL